MEVTSLSNFSYKHISEVTQTANNWIKKLQLGDIRPLITSIKGEQERIGGFLPGEQIVVAGRTGTGKTSKILHMMKDFTNTELNPFYKDNLVILYDTWEMPDWRNMIRLYSRRHSLTVKELLSYQEKLEKEKLDMIITISEEFKGLPIYFNQINQSVLEWFKNKKQIYALLLEKNPNTQIVNIVDHTRLVKSTKEFSEEQLITSFMKAGMELKNEFGMINFFLSQMNRNIESGDRDDLANRTPISSDLFGSDSIFQCADAVFALHRPGLYGAKNYKTKGNGAVIPIIDKDGNDFLMLECVLKQRDGWTGIIPLRHDLKYNNFTDL